MASLQERLDRMPFVLSGVLMGPDGWPAQGEHHYRLTQVPEELFKDSEEVLNGVVTCDELGFFKIRLQDFEIDSQEPVLLRLGTSEEVVRGIARWQLVDHLEGMQLYSVEGHFRQSEVSGKKVYGIELGQVQLADLPLVKEVWLGSDEIDELSFRIHPFVDSGWGRMLEDWQGREFTLRTDRPLRLYGERSDLHLRFLPDPNTNWKGRATCPMGGSLVVEVFPPSEVRLTVSPKDHPEGYRWQLVRAVNYENKPIEAKEGWSWTQLVDQRCGLRSTLSADSRTLRNRAPGSYKVLVWSREPTPGRLPLRVTDIQIVSGDQEIRIR